MRPSRLPTGSTPRQISAPAEKSTSRSEGRSGWIRAARISRSSELATSGAPWSCSTAPSSASRPRRGRAMPCQWARKRASAAGSTGSTCLRSFASERRFSALSTSASIHSRPRPPGRNSPSSTRSCAASRSRALRTTATPAPHRAARSSARKGPCVRAQRVPHAGGVLGGGPPLLPGEVHGKGAPLLEELQEGRLAFEPPADLRLREIAESEQQVVQPVRAVRRPAQSLSRLFVLLDRACIEQLAHLRLAEQLPELCLIHRKRLRASLGKRRVPVVDEVRDVAEEQRGCERRGSARLDRQDPQAPVLDPPQDFLEARKIEHVTQAFPVGLEEQREAPVARSHLEEVPGALALRPERAAPAWVPARQEQGPSRVLPKSCGEERRGD